MAPWPVLGRLRPTGSGHGAFGSSFGRERQRFDFIEIALENTQRLPKVNSPKSPPTSPDLLPPAPQHFRSSLPKIASKSA